MCGRFTLATPAEILEALFEVSAFADWNEPRYNIAPQTRIVTVRGGGARRIAQSLLWGAINPQGSRPLINARSETVATSPLFGRAFLGSRVLIPADGFFEWTRERERRLARFFTREKGAPFAFAGITVDPPKAAEPAEPAAVILTTEASESMKSYHDRMPVILPREAFDLWLDHGTSPKDVLDVMTAGARTQWRSHPVGPLVNNVRNDSPECIAFADPVPEPQGRLF